MTALLASLGLLPAALSHGIGSDTQRPFAIVIIGGLLLVDAAHHAPAAHDSTSSPIAGSAAGGRAHPEAPEEP